MITSESLEKVLQLAMKNRVVKLVRLITQPIPRSIFEKNNHIWPLRYLDVEEINASFRKIKTICYYKILGIKFFTANPTFL
jgi:hypothetical protein